MQGEQVVGVIPAAQAKVSFFSSKTYALVFTAHRLILAEGTKELVAAEVARAKEAAKTGGSNVFGQVGAQLKAGSSFGMQYVGADPDAILAQVPGNTAYAPADIRELKVDRKTRTVGGEDGVDQEFLKVTLETRDGKRTFETGTEVPPVDEARRMVAWFMGPRQG
jgi:hypothetical protein